MSFDVEFEHDDEVQGIIELLGYPNSSVEEDMARLQGLWGRPRYPSRHLPRSFITSDVDRASRRVPARLLSNEAT